MPNSLKHLAPTSGRGSVVELARLVRGSSAEIHNTRQKSQLEVKLISWLYDFIRENVKRGRVFDLHDAGGG